MEVFQVLALFSVLSTVQGWNWNWCWFGCTFNKRGRALGYKRTAGGKIECNEKRRYRCAMTFKEGNKFMTCLDLCAHHKDESPDGGHLVSMNPNFNAYDLHSKGCFDFMDFCISVGLSGDDPSMKKAFDVANTDKDKADDCIDPVEFAHANWIFTQDESNAIDTGDVVKYNEEDQGSLKKVLEDEAHGEEATKRKNTEDADLSETIRSIKRMLYQNRY